MDDDFRKAALDYHRLPRPGKLEVAPTKRMATQRDLALAYSPGVAAACEEIKANPLTAFDYTARGNLVGVISNGTAVLGLGNIGALAGKPVMEGKAVLFKKVRRHRLLRHRGGRPRSEPVRRGRRGAGADLRRDQPRRHQGARMLRHRAQALRERMSIPVFHDDQHGTAIIVAAAVRNGLELQGKKLAEEVLVVTSGAGAAALACIDLLCAMGLNPANVTLTDIKGVIYAGRDADMLPNMARYANETTARTLAEALPGADIFLGLSAPRVLKAEWLPLLADKPLILALANPEPEILPEAVRAARPDAIVATGRQRLPEPGQQRPVLPVHLPRRAGRGRHHHQRGDEARLRGGDRRAGPGGGERGGRRGLWRRRPRVRPGLHHPQAVRPPPDPTDRPGRGGQRDAHGRRHPADRGFRRLPPRAGSVRLPLRPADAPGVRGARGNPPAASSTPTARTSGCCAPCRPSSTTASPSRSCSAAAA